MPGLPSTTPVVLAADTPFLDWAAFGKVAGVSFLFALGVVVVFSIGIVGLSMARGHDVEEGVGADGRPVRAVRGGRPLGAAVAGTCFVACGAAVLYGLWLIVPQFH